MAKNDSHKPPEPEPDEPTVSCDVCLIEIPHSAAHSAEGTEYVRYFCGLDCYEQWLQEDEGKPEDGKDEGEGSGPS